MAEPAKRRGSLAWLVAEGSLLFAGPVWVAEESVGAGSLCSDFLESYEITSVLRKSHSGMQEAFAYCGLFQYLRGLLYLQVGEISRNNQIMENSLK